MTRWLLAMAVLGCSSPRPETAPVGSGSAPTPAATHDAPVAPVAPDPFVGYPPRLAAPESKCVLEGEWRDQPKTLAFTDGGKPFGEVFEVTEASATLGAGAFAELTTATVRLAGYVDKSKLHIHAAAAFLVADFVAPGPKLAMKYVSTQVDQITFELPLPAFAKSKASLRTTRACGILTVDDQTDFSPRDAIDARAQSEGLLRANQAVPLWVELGKPPIATLRYKSSPPIDVLETSGKHARVVVEIGSLNPAEHVVFVGWVPASSVIPRGGGFGGSWATGGDRAAQRKPRQKDAKVVACPRETPLAVELAGERRTVGSVLPNVALGVLADGDLTEVRFVKSNVELVEGARWLVTRAALAGCVSP
ncbi:MAG: hypothetical protein H0T65_07420 [Deltaproteobacteria bacterium]|nr:hypothetical protein [Deltaproteobacteria bacterium]